MRQEDRDEKAAERYKIITPLLNDALDDKAVVQLRRELAAQYGLDERTLRRWINDYKNKGFEGLKPAQRSNLGDRIIPPAILNTAIQLRREVPGRSVKTLIEIMELDGTIPQGSVKRSTLQDALAEAGFSKKQMRLYQPAEAESHARRFQKPNRNDCWQCDVKYGPYIDKKQTYLFVVLDDASRYVTHSEFFFHQDQKSLNITLQKAFTKAGIPTVLYLDNGKIFKSSDTNRMAAKLGIRLSHIKPYTPQGHGKIERFNRTVEGFLNEWKLEKDPTIEKLNHFYEAWLEDRYQRVVHSALEGLTPEQAFETDTAEIRFATPDELGYAFMSLQRRKVNKAGCISLNNEQWEIELGSLMIGREVAVLIDPNHPDTIRVECDGLLPCSGKKLVIQPNTGMWSAKPSANAASTASAPKQSKLLRGIRERYDERKQKESLSVQKDILEDARSQEEGPSESLSADSSKENTERRDILRFSASSKKGDQ